MGLVLGTLTSLLSAQLLIGTPLARAAWLLPTAAVLAAFALPRVRRRLRSGSTVSVGLEEGGTVALGIGIGLLFIWSFWREHPLRWEGWWRYYVDIPFHEALATSLATWGPDENILVAGEPTRYHWFAHAWAGLTTQASDAGSFVVVTRVLPLVALVGTICLTWAWSRRLSDLRSVPILAVLVATLAMDVGSQLPLSFLQNFTVSPSMGIAALWLLGSSFLLSEHLAGRLERPEPLLFLMAFACVGGKVSNAAVLVGGVGLVALLSLVTRTSRKRAWVDAAVVVSAVATGFVALIAGSEGRLVLEFGASARTYAFLYDTGLIGLTIGTATVILAITAKWAGIGVLFLSRSTRNRPDAWFALGAAATGLVLMAALGHPGGSQLYFSLSASIVVVVVCGWGLGEALRWLLPRTLLYSVLAGVTTGFAGFAALGGRFTGTESLPALLFPPLVAWIAPVILVTVVLVRRDSMSSHRSLVVCASAAGWSLVVASLTFGAITLADTVRTPRPTAPAANARLAWTSGHVAALNWLREHSAVNDIVATNRQCSAPQIGAAGCTRARWFLTAALSHRRMLIEGSDYAVDTERLPRWATERVALSRRFVDRPSESDRVTLWRAEVRWILVDLASTDTRGWSPYARRAFANDTTVVLRLNSPEALISPGE